MLQLPVVLLHLLRENLRHLQPVRRCVCREGETGSFSKHFPLPYRVRWVSACGPLISNTSPSQPSYQDNTPAMPLFRRRRKENSDSQHGKEGVNEEACTRTTEVLAGDRIRWTLIWPTSGLEGKRLTAEGCMASVLSMYVLVLKGPQRRSILKYGPYKDHVRFVSQFPTADVRLFLKNLNTYQFLTWYCVSTKCVTHWDNRNGRLGVKHQITYLLTYIVSTQGTSVVTYGESHVVCQWIQVHAPQQTDVHWVKLMCLN